MCQLEQAHSTEQSATVTAGGLSFRAGSISWLFLTGLFLPGGGARWGVFLWGGGLKEGVFCEFYFGFGWIRKQGICQPVTQLYWNMIQTASNWSTEGAEKFFWGGLEISKPVFKEGLVSLKNRCVNNRGVLLSLCPSLVPQVTPQTITI